MRQVWTPSALLTEDFGSVRFFIEPITTPQSVTIIFGPREAGKTQLLFTMMRAMHEQRRLLERFPSQCGRVALVEVDMTLPTTQERLRKASVEYNFKDELCCIAAPTTIDIARVKPDTPWVRAVAEFDPDVIAFDSLRKVHRGNENDPAVPSFVYGCCKELFPRSAFWFAHHVKKPPATWLQEKEQYDPGEDPNVYRGTTAWLDDADAAIYLHKDAKSNKRTFRLTRARYAPDYVKQEIIGVALHRDSMFLEPSELSESQWALHWRLANPSASVGDAVQALIEQFPSHAEKTYYNWANQAKK